MLTLQIKRKKKVLLIISCLWLQKGRLCLLTRLTFPTLCQCHSHSFLPAELCKWALLPVCQTGSCSKSACCMIWWKGVWGRQKSPALGAGEQTGWAGRKEVPASTGTTGSGNVHLSPFCASATNSFICLLFFLSKQGNCNNTSSNLSPVSEYQSENKLSP